MNVVTKTVSVQTRDGEMPAHVARPQASGKPLPAVIVVQEAFGLNDNIRSIADRIAAEGYVAIAPNFYHREGGKVVGYAELPEAIGLLQRWTDDQAVADFRGAIDFLKSDAGVRAERIGITGFCMGGRASYLAACECPEVRASVPYYGGAIAGQQFSPSAKPPVEKTAQMKAAIQLHFGERDSYIPLSAVEEIRQALERAGKEYEIHVYPGAGHGFMCPDRADYDAEASKLAWGRTVSFFGKHLGS